MKNLQMGWFYIRNLTHYKVPRRKDQTKKYPEKVRDLANAEITENANHKVFVPRVVVQVAVNPDSLLRFFMS